jgi:O-antigen ligase
VVFGITPPEIVLIVMIFYFLCVVMLKLKTFYVNSLDWIIIAFVFFALIPVVISTENLYVAARDYRHLFLTPLFAYLLLQVCFEKVKQMNTALLVCTAILIIGTIFRLPYYLAAGIRLESGFNTISVAVMCSWSVAICFLTRNDLPNAVYKFLNYIILLYMLTLIFFVGSRAVILGFVIASALSFLVIGKKLYQKLFLIFIVAGIISFYFSLLVIDENMLKVDTTLTEEYREVSHSVFRLASVEHWIYDLKLRMSLWKKAFSIGLENPILGAGASKYRSLYLSTPHNVFISVFLTSGLLGTLTFLFLIVICYSTFFSFYDLQHYRRITKFFFISFTTLLFVGATNDFSGGRYLLFFILISGISIAQKNFIKRFKTNDQTK